MITGFFDLSVRFGMPDAVALCATLNGRETSKDTDFCVRRARDDLVVEDPVASGSNWLTPVKRDFTGDEEVVEK